MNRLSIITLSSVLLLAAAGAQAKCTVTLRFTNTDAHEITIFGNDSQARINGLTWSKMSFNDVTLAPGASGNATWTTNQSCGGNAKRDLRFRFKDSAPNDGSKYSEVFENIDIEDGETYRFDIKND